MPLFIEFLMTVRVPLSNPPVSLPSNTRVFSELNWVKADVKTFGVISIIICRYRLIYINFQIAV